MSDGKNQNNGALTNEKNFSFSRGKDAAILVGWIAALVLVAGLCWFFTQPVRSRSLQRAVNRVLVQSGDHRRLLEAEKAGFLGLDSWYSMTAISGDGLFAEGTKAFVFTFIGGGTFFPCAAVVNPKGKVEEFIPLGSHGEKMIKRVSPEALGLYARRIEGAES